MNPTTNKADYIFLTFTWSGGLTKEHCSKARDWLLTLEYSLCCKEFGESGINTHLHALVFKPHVKTGNLRRVLLKLVYGLERTDPVDKHTLKVEVAKSITASVVYISKYVVDDKYFVRTGFMKTWIHEQVKVGLKTRKQFTQWQYVSVDQAPGYIIEYCRIHKRDIHSISDFGYVISLIDLENVNTRKWKRDYDWIYARIMNVQGQHRFMSEIPVQACRFLEAGSNSL